MKKKQAKHTKPLKEQLTNTLVKTRDDITAHGIVVMFVIAGLAVGYALYSSNTLVNPTRNEAKYQELTAASQVRKIDYNIVDRLSDALDDIDVVVTQQIDPNRNNPFNE